jgi:hypothetical protein
MVHYLWLLLTTVSPCLVIQSLLTTSLIFQGSRLCIPFSQHMMLSTTREAWVTSFVGTCLKTHWELMGTCLKTNWELEGTHWEQQKSNNRTLPKREKPMPPGCMLPHLIGFKKVFAYLCSLQFLA